MSDEVNGVIKQQVEKIYVNKRDRASKPNRQEKDSSNQGRHGKKTGCECREISGRGKRVWPTPHQPMRMRLKSRPKSELKKRCECEHRQVQAIESAAFRTKTKMIKKTKVLSRSSQLTCRLQWQSDPTLQMSTIY